LLPWCSSYGQLSGLPYRAWCHPCGSYEHQPSSDVRPWCPRYPAYR